MEGRPRGPWHRRVLVVVAVAVGSFLAIQLVPYGWTHANPPVTSAAPWPNPEAEAIARESCYSCHSNETDWPAYSYVAPMSWLVRRDVEAGRAALNFSEWASSEGDADDAADEVEDRAMPPRQYTLVHPGARLTDEEAAVLLSALEQMDDGGERSGEHRDENGSGRGRGRGRGG